MWAKQKRYIDRKINGINESTVKTMYTIHSRKRQGFRRNLLVGPKDAFEMKEIMDLKPRDLLNIERFVICNGCDIFCERIEKTVHGVSNITIWTNKNSFTLWQKEIDNIWRADIMEGSMQHCIRSSQLCTDLNEHLTEWKIVLLNPMEGDRPTFRHYSCGSIVPRLLEDQEDLGMFGFVVYVFWPYRPHVYLGQTFCDINNDQYRQRAATRNRKKTKRMTYNTLGNPKIE